METKHSQSERKFDLREKASGPQWAKILQVEGNNQLKLITLDRKSKPNSTKNAGFGPATQTPHDCC